MLYVWLSQCMLLRSCRRDNSSQNLQKPKDTAYTPTARLMQTYAVILLHALCLTLLGTQWGKNSQCGLSRAHALEQYGFFASGDKGETNEHRFSRIT